jgi:PIF1-like helicase/Helix-turn-helix domain
MLQSQALDILKTGANVFLTGSAGSGKTFVLNQYISYLKDRDVCVAVTASTGIAATHMSGMTIHSWSGLGIRDQLTERDIDDLEQKAYLWTRFEKTKVLIIDEISMLHSYRLDMVNTICKTFKRSNKPFGGLQVVLCGDFFQLPPITRTIARDDVSDSYEAINHSAYTATSWKEAGFITCYLTEQHRQEDKVFLDVLNGIRTGVINEAVLAPLRTRYQKSISLAIDPTKLYTHNVDVDTINSRELASLSGDIKTFIMTSSGKDHIVETLKKSVLAHEHLQLKIGARVLFVKNNFEAGYANGTLGIVKSFLPDGIPVVQTAQGIEIHASPVDWSIEEDGKVKASVTQIPLRHAWAITIHKSQGMSLDAAEIDLSKSFAYGMGYVALSRVRTLAGISLIGMHKDALNVNPDVLILNESLQVRSEEAEELFGKIKKDELLLLQKQFVINAGGTLAPEKIVQNQKREKNKKGLKNSEVKLKSHLVTKEMIGRGMTLQSIADERGFALGTVISHLEDLQKEGILFEMKHIKADKKLVSAVKKAIKMLDDTKLTPIKDYVEKKEKIKASFDEIRLARLFV